MASVVDLSILLVASVRPTYFEHSWYSVPEKCSQLAYFLPSKIHRVAAIACISFSNVFPTRMIVVCLLVITIHIHWASDDASMDHSDTESPVYGRYGAEAVNACLEINFIRTLPQISNYEPCHMHHLQLRRISSYLYSADGLSQTILSLIPYKPSEVEHILSNGIYYKN